MSKEKANKNIFDQALERFSDEDKVILRECVTTKFKVAQNTMPIGKARELDDRIKRHFAGSEFANRWGSDKEPFATKRKRLMKFIKAKGQGGLPAKDLNARFELAYDMIKETRVYQGSGITKIVDETDSEGYKKFIENTVLETEAQENDIGTQGQLFEQRFAQVAADIKKMTGANLYRTGIDNIATLYRDLTEVFNDNLHLDNAVTQNFLGYVAKFQRQIFTEDNAEYLNTKGPELKGTVLPVGGGGGVMGGEPEPVVVPAAAPAAAPVLSREEQIAATIAQLKARDAGAAAESKPLIEQGIIETDKLENNPDAQLAYFSQLFADYNAILVKHYGGNLYVRGLENPRVFAGEQNRNLVRDGVNMTVADKFMRYIWKFKSQIITMENAVASGARADQINLPKPKERDVEGDAIKDALALGAAQKRAVPAPPEGVHPLVPAAPVRPISAQPSAFVPPVGMPTPPHSPPRPALPPPAMGEPEDAPPLVLAGELALDEHKFETDGERVATKRLIVETIQDELGKGDYDADQHLRNIFEARMIDLQEELVLSVDSDTMNESVFANIPQYINDSIVAIVAQINSIPQGNDADSDISGASSNLSNIAEMYSDFSGGVDEHLIDEHAEELELEREEKEGRRRDDIARKSIDWDKASAAKMLMAIVGAIGDTEIFDKLMKGMDKEKMKAWIKHVTDARNEYLISKDKRIREEIKFQISQMKIRLDVGFGNGASLRPASVGRVWYGEMQDMRDEQVHKNAVEHAKYLPKNFSAPVSRGVALAQELRRKDHIQELADKELEITDGYLATSRSIQKGEQFKHYSQEMKPLRPIGNGNRPYSAVPKY
jgi:hypothetical protein